MPLPKKYEGSKTRGLRLDSVTDIFLRENFLDRKIKSANDFIIELIKNSDEFKNYLVRKKTQDTTPTLDLYAKTETYAQIKTDMDKAINAYKSGDMSHFEKFGTGWHK